MQETMNNFNTSKAIFNYTFKVLTVCKWYKYTSSYGSGDYLASLIYKKRTYTKNKLR